MQLAPHPADAPPPADVPTALRNATARLGHRPAVTLIRRSRREEQSVASLAQWAAKGAHLLEHDLLLCAGDRISLVTPPGWAAATVCLAAWWAGVTVDLDGEADVAVVHESCRAPDGARDVLWFGDDLDGSPLAGVEGEIWPRAVQTFPDQPPPARGRGDLPALEHAGRRWTQTQALQDAAALTVHTGTLGVDGGGSPGEVLLALALRPLVVGRPTVVLTDSDRSAAAGDRVASWLGDERPDGGADPR